MMFINILTHAPWTSLHETYFLLLAIWYISPLFDYSV
jgi:hypothetical protein